MTDPSPAPDPAQVAAALRRAGLRELDAAGVLLDDLGIRRPSLDDVFLTLTGRAAVSAADDQKEVA